MKDGPIIYGSTSNDAYVLFWKLMVAGAQRHVSGLSQGSKARAAPAMADPLFSFRLIPGTDHFSLPVCIVLHTRGSQ